MTWCRCGFDPLLDTDMPTACSLQETLHYHPGVRRQVINTTSFALCNRMIVLSEVETSAEV